MVFIYFIYFTAFPTNNSSFLGLKCMTAWWQAWSIGDKAHSLHFTFTNDTLHLGHHASQTLTICMWQKCSEKDHQDKSHKAWEVSGRRIHYGNPLPHSRSPPPNFSKIWEKSVCLLLGSHTCLSRHHNSPKLWASVLTSCCHMVVSVCVLLELLPQDASQHREIKATRLK